MIKRVIQGMELVLFVLPALPENFWVRIGIMWFYYMLHVYKVQNSYARFKKSFLKYERPTSINHLSVESGPTEIIYHNYE
jgi:hypothetical protein